MRCLPSLHSSAKICLPSSRLRENFFSQAASSRSEYVSPLSSGSRSSAVDVEVEGNTLVMMIVNTI